MALLETFDGVKIGVHDAPEQELLEMEDISRDLSQFESRERQSEDHVLLKCVNALPHEYDI